MLNAPHMLDAFLGVLRDRPELTFFLVLGTGFLLGRLKLGKFSLGAVTGTLLAGVAYGQLDLRVSADLKEYSMLLFLFAIGFRVGPQFFRGLKSDGRQHALLATIICLAGLGAAYLVSRLFGFHSGTAAGIIAGSMTQSPTIGSASDAISRLPLSAERIAEMTSGVAVAYAVTYLIGVIVCSWFLAHVAPRLMRIDLAEECRLYESRLPGFGAKVQSARQEVEYRAYTVQPGSALVGRTVREIEALAAEERLFIERMRRGDRLFDPDEETVVAAGDRLAITGRRERVVPALHGRAGLLEVDDPELLQIPADAVDLVVTRTGAAERTLVDLAAEEGMRSVYLLGLSRSGMPVAVSRATTVQRGDVLKVAGPARRVARAAGLIGEADRVTNVTDMAMIALAIFAGALIGVPTFRLGTFELGLGTSVGVLLAGVSCGYLRSTWPAAVRGVPGGALWFFESVGLAGFVGIVGLEAGPRFLSGLKATGLPLVIAGLVVAIVPGLVGLGLGRWLFRIPGPVLLGICAGAGGAAPALAAVQEVAKSPVPSLGYGVPFAISNILLTLWGPVLVALL